VSAPTAVVHLVWEPAGMATFERFVRSYERCDAGADHDLVLLLNGVEDVAAYRERVAGLGAAEIVLPTRSLDLPAYLAAARELPHDRVCFMNSYAEIRAPGWLRILCAPLDAAGGPGAGAAAASGSWASHRSFALSLLRLPNGYHGSLGDSRLMNPALRSVSTAPNVGLTRRIVRAAAGLPAEIVGYPGFPAAHLRTNGFVIGRELLLSLRAGALDTKDATYRFESGRRSMTAQLLARDLCALVVSRAGTARAPADWPAGDVFWQAGQEDLLIADNQTRQYDDGDRAVREALSRYAWGPRARWT
jgi:hypothetical protein